MASKHVKTREAFEAEIAAAEGRFVLFYSGWCPFCTAFLPCFDDRARAGGGVFLRVCTDDLPELEDRFSVEVVPTVLFFKAGKLHSRLDGALGRGLSAGGLDCFVAGCAAPAKRKK